MNKEITISELARLMNVSVHQIRYFEEKGVLQPAYTDSSRYRIYGISEIYRLTHILLLRKLGVPVKSIGDHISDFSADQYRGQWLYVWRRRSLAILPYRKAITCPSRV